MRPIWRLVVALATGIVLGFLTMYVANIVNLVHSMGSTPPAGSCTYIQSSTVVSTPSSVTVRGGGTFCSWSHGTSWLVVACGIAGFAAGAMTSYWILRRRSDGRPRPEGPMPSAIV